MLKILALELAPLLWVGAFLCLKFAHATRMTASNLDFVQQTAQSGDVGPGAWQGALAVLLPVIAVTLLLPRLWRYGFLVLLHVGATTLVLIDLLHITFYNAVPSLLESVSLRQLYEIRASLLDLLEPVHAAYFLDAVVLLLLAPAYLRLVRGVPALAARSRLAASVALVLLASLLALPTGRDVVAAGAWSDGQTLREISATAGVLPYHVADLYLYLSDEGSLSEDERQQALAYLRQHRSQPVEPAASRGVAKGANLILLSAESLMAFPLGLTIDGQPVTPYLDTFAAESLNFINFHDQTGVGNTADAEFMALQSLHPLPLSSVGVGHSGNRFRALPSLLAAEGYATLSATGEPGWFWGMAAMHRKLGFQESYFAESFDLADKIGGWLADASFFRQMAGRLAEHRQPFMAYLLSSSNHHPFKLPKRLKQLRLGKLEGRRLGDYLHSVHYFDQAFGLFMAALRRAGLLDSSVVALYGDHAAFLGDDALRDLSDLVALPGGARFRHLRIYKRVPLIVRLPGGRPHRRIKTIGGHLDIAPTLLGLLGLEDPTGAMLGRDLLARAPRLVVFRDGSFVSPEAYYSRRFGRRFVTRCFALEGGAEVDCASLEAAREQAEAKLQASDTIIRGDLIPEIADRLGGQ